MAEATSDSASLPAAPISWGLTDNSHDSSGSGGGGDRHFANMTLNDEDFDEPVYRSLSVSDLETSVYRSFGSSAGLEAEATGGLALEDEPHFCGLFFDEPEAQPAARKKRAMSVEEAERAWLDSMAMPPLVKRQKAQRSLPVPGFP